MTQLSSNNYLRLVHKLLLHYFPYLQLINLYLAQMHNFQLRRNPNTNDTFRLYFMFFLQYHCLKLLLMIDLDYKYLKSTSILNILKLIIFCRIWRYTPTILKTRSISIKLFHFYIWITFIRKLT